VVPIIDVREKEQAMKQVMIIDDSPQIRERIAGLLAESPQIRIAGRPATVATPSLRFSA
jgi:DNA-binding NarL/FixJ family response regulator